MPVIRAVGDVLYSPLKAPVVYPAPQRELGQNKAEDIGELHLMTPEWTEFFIRLQGFTTAAVMGDPNQTFVTDANGVLQPSTSLPPVTGSLVTNLNATALTLGRVPPAVIWRSILYIDDGQQNDADFLDANIVVAAPTGGSLELTGIEAGVDGQTFSLIHGSGDIVLKNNDPASALGNRIITGVEGDLGIFVSGYVSLVYDAGFWRVLAWQQGSWLSLPPTPARFTAATGTWTVDPADLVTDAFLLHERTFLHTCVVENSTLSLNTASVSVAIPFGTLAHTVRTVGHMMRGGAARVVLVEALAGTSVVTLSPVDAPPHFLGGGVDNNDFSFQIEVEI